MIDSNSRDARNYMDSYLKKLKRKFLKNKETKQELMNTLSEEERTPEKNKEIDEKHKVDMREFVEKLKSDPKFDIYQKKYHEDIQEIRKILKDTSILTKEKWEKTQREYITRMFPKAKEAAFKAGNQFEWDKFVKRLWTNLKRLNNSEKEKMFKTLGEILSTPENIAKAINGIKNTDTSDRVTYTMYLLLALFGLGMGIHLLDNEANWLIVKLLGASWFVYGVKHVGRTVKEASIAGGNTEINNRFKEHKYNHNSEDLVPDAE